jgi:hypothetical protein
MLGLEFHVEHRTDDLDDLAEDVSHACFLDELPADLFPCPPVRLSACPFVRLSA